MTSVVEVYIIWAALLMAAFVSADSWEGIAQRTVPARRSHPTMELLSYKSSVQLITQPVTK